MRGTAEESRSTEHYFKLIMPKMLAMMASSSASTTIRNCFQVHQNNISLAFLPDSIKSARKLRAIKKMLQQRSTRTITCHNIRNAQTITRTSSAPVPAVRITAEMNPNSENLSTFHNRRNQYYNNHCQHHQHQQCRHFARSSEDSPSSAETPEDEARKFIISLGHEAKIAQGVVDALKQAGLSGGMLPSTVRSLAGRVEVDEDAGLEALIQSVTVDLARKEGKKLVNFYCIPQNAWKEEEELAASDESTASLPVSDDDTKRYAFAVEGYEGMSLTDVAKFGTGEGAKALGESIECACAGIMACSTCHVVIDEAWFDAVGEACEAEQDMIDLAYHPQRTSRLGCQLILSKKLDGMIIKLPKSANNLMDHIPFQD